MTSALISQSRSRRRSSITSSFATARSTSSYDVGGRASAHAPVAGEREQREAVGDVPGLLGRLERVEALRLGWIQDRRRDDEGEAVGPQPFHQVVMLSAVQPCERVVDQAQATRDVRGISVDRQHAGDLGAHPRVLAERVRLPQMFERLRAAHVDLSAGKVEEQARALLMRQGFAQGALEVRGGDLWGALLEGAPGRVAQDCRRRGRRTRLGRQEVRGQPFGGRPGIG